ncbi:MAG TPA: glycosyltransferase [Bryobacteraceae bacterium]
MRKPAIVILGLSVTSSWGNGHATTYRSLIRGLAARGRDTLFLERDVPWYAANRDSPHPPGAVTRIYDSFDELTARFEREVAEAELVIVGSYVPDGARVGEWVTSIARGVTAFYDIDTPVTLTQLIENRCEYLTRALIPRYHLYLSFTGGPVLRMLESSYGSPMARELYCSVDTDAYRPQPRECRWDLGYLGTYSEDRQKPLEQLLFDAASAWRDGRFVVAGPMYPDYIAWPPRVERIVHLAPDLHPAFYASQRFTLNLTRTAMKSAGYSPSVRLFEAGACGVPIISDWWDGLETLFRPGREILISADAEDTLRYLTDLPERARLAIGEAARARILAAHTPAHRAEQLESYLKEAHDNFAAHAARRNGRRRPVPDGKTQGLAVERNGNLSGAVPGRRDIEALAEGAVRESAGAGD